MLVCRKNIYTLTGDEWAAFADALDALKSSGRYDEYVKTHSRAMYTATPWGSESANQATRNAAHRGPAFLPWHREFLRRLEIDLQTVRPGVSIPYWDWTQDALLSNPNSAEIWTASLAGGDGTPISSGPFAHWATIELDNSSGSPSAFTFSPSGGIDRTLAGTSWRLPRAEDVDYVMGLDTYDNSPWDRSPSSSFRNVLEGWKSYTLPSGEGVSAPALHNVVHVWVGGDMSPSTSPNDPVFFLHHCNVDRIWAMWQLRHPESGYLPVSGGPSGHNWNDPMYPWPTTPADVWDHRELGYVYDTEQFVALLNLRRELAR